MHVVKIQESKFYVSGQDLIPFELKVNGDECFEFTSCF